MEIAELLQSRGLLLRGGFMLDPDLDAALLDLYPDARQLLLVGNAGSAIWPHLKPYVAANPTSAHPLDDWTLATLQNVAREIDATCLFPFGGPPYWPFQRWAQRADNVHPSPISILIHPDFGLWHAYRGALVMGHAIDPPALMGGASPCDSCIERPCLTACPVQAFSAAGYDVENCAGHVNGHSGGECRSHGCLARLACPVGASWRYDPDHAAFHMDAFRRAHPARPQSDAI